MLVVRTYLEGLVISRGTLPPDISRWADILPRLQHTFRGFGTRTPLLERRPLALLEFYEDSQRWRLTPDKGKRVSARFLQPKGRR